MPDISVTVDGVRYEDHVEPRLLLVHYLREVVGKTGTPVGCDTSNCGACTVLMDGQSVKSCSVLAVQADGAEVTTIEGLAGNGEWHPVQKAFHERARAAVRLLHARDDHGRGRPAAGEPRPQPTQEIREGLEGNLCRCTGYENIVRAVQARRRGGSDGE